MDLIKLSNLFISLCKTAFKHRIISTEEAQSIADANNIPLPTDEGDEFLLEEDGSKLGLQNGEFYHFSYNAAAEEQQKEEEEEEVGRKRWENVIEGWRIEYRYRVTKHLKENEEYKMVILYKENGGQWAFDIEDDNLIPLNDFKHPFSIDIRTRKSSSGKERKKYCVIRFDDGKKFAFPLDIIEPEISGF